MRKNICFCLALVILLSSVSMIVGAVNFSSMIVGTSELGIVEQKLFSAATLEADFADNHVLVVLNNKASLKFKEYSPADFKEVKCAAVSDLTSGKKKQVETKVNDFKSSVSTMSAESRATAVEEINEYNQIICLELADKGKENVLAAIKALQSRDDVMYAGPDYIMSLCSVIPNDTYWTQQWAIAAIDLNQTWDVTTGSSSVVVGILDSGIDYMHPDLQGKVSSTYSRDFTSGVEEYVLAPDDYGHGTHVAGIVGAAIDNTGIAGVCGNVTLASLKVFDSSGQGPFSHLIMAIDCAEDACIPILNFSGGKDNISSSDCTSLSASIDNYSGLLICSAGNIGYNIDSISEYPASLEHEQILCVGASANETQRWYSSNYGEIAVDVFAPGVDILSCFPTSRCLNGTCENNPMFADTHYNDSIGYHLVSGTSMAAPYVTGIAALMLSENPDLTPLQIKNRIIATCKDYSDYTNKCVSGGIVNAYHAVLNAYTSTTMTLDSSRSASIADGGQYWVKFTATSAGTYFFFTTGGLHTVGELFDSDAGRLVCSSNADSTTSSNFYIEQYLDADAVVYLKITIKGTPTSGSFVVNIAS